MIIRVSLLQELIEYLNIVKIVCERSNKSTKIYIMTQADLWYPRTHRSVFVCPMIVSWAKQFVRSTGCTAIPWCTLQVHLYRHRISRTTWCRTGCMFWDCQLSPSAKDHQNRPVCKRFPTWNFVLFLRKKPFFFRSITIKNVFLPTNLSLIIRVPPIIERVTNVDETFPKWFWIQLFRKRCFCVN